MKKIFIILISAFILTGCSAEYTIKIDKNMIKDDVFIYDELAKFESTEQIEYASNVLADFQMGYEFYEKAFSLKNVKVGGYHFTSYLKYDEYDAMSIVRKCYDDITVDTESTIKITTTSKFLCFDYYEELSSVKVHLKTTYKVINTNADSEVDNIYTWNITKDNANSKPIYLEFEKEKKDYSGIGITIALVVIALVLVVMFIMKTFNNLNDKNRF